VWLLLPACAGLLLPACARPGRPRYPVHVTVLVFPQPTGSAAGACAVVTVPHSAQVSLTDHDALVWDVVDDACKAADFQVTSPARGFARYFEAPVGQPNEVTRHLRKRAAVKAGARLGGPSEALKYAVEVKTAAGQTLREDPEIVIWP
jgi:hypothetical protein